MSHDAILQQFIDRHLAVVGPLAREAALANWEMQTVGSDEARDRAVEMSARLSKVYANPDDYALLKSLPHDGISDPLLQRQHTLLLQHFLSHQMDEKVIEEIVALELGIEDEYNNYRATLRGGPVSDNEIDDILIGSDDVALRREAWEASKTVGAAVADKVLHLVRLRNREAQRLGFADYYVMGLALQDLDEMRLFALLDDLHQQSETLWNDYKAELDARLAARFGIPLQEVRPWHHANRFFQEPGSGEADLDRFFADKDLVELTRSFFAQIGLPIEDLLQRADLFERENKCQHAFCMDIDRKGDVRVLCNNRPNERWMGTMLHEFGHAVYDKFHDDHLPYLLREPAHTLSTEAIALFMGRLDKDARWLRHYAGVSAAEAEQIEGQVKREVCDHLLIFMHWCFVMVHFERALYADPEQDLNALWWALVEKYQKVICPAADRPPHSWAAKVHLATAPVYYHNYLLGEMVASQLLHHINTTVLKGEGPDALVASPKVGAYLEDQVFAPGAIRPWEEWLEHATGERLNPAYFVAQLAE
jgi:peptidyl-dipeptidase A